MKIFMKFKNGGRLNKSFIVVFGSIDISLWAMAIFFAMPTSFQYRKFLSPFYCRREKVIEKSKM